MWALSLPVLLIYISQNFCNAFFDKAFPTKGFNLPASFIGTWIGSPTFNILGPFMENSYKFIIAKATNGDYLMEVNLGYDELTTLLGWQRFYIDGSNESSAGTMYYCGYLSNYTQNIEKTGSGRINQFFSLINPTSESPLVTFCLNSSNPQVSGSPLDPFKNGCSGCDCANWTIYYDSNSRKLISQMSMSGADGETHSKHMWTELTLLEPAPFVEGSYMPGHGANFSCDFSDNGRDNVPVTYSQEADTSAGCPFLMKKNQNAKIEMSKLPNSKTSNTSEKSASKTMYDNCYYLNKVVEFQIEWTVDNDKKLLSCAISAPIKNNNTWIGIGFRPLSRSMDPILDRLQTGHHQNFGMEGADIVVGSINNGIRNLYAEKYTGPPIPDSSLELSDSSIFYNKDTSVLSVIFTRPLVSGFLLKNYNINASIATGYSDIIWAMGVDSSESDDGNESTCDYHSNKRGLRYIDWVNPTSYLLEEWKC